MILLGFDLIGQQIVTGVPFGSLTDLQFETRFDWRTEVFDRRFDVNPFTAAIKDHPNMGRAIHP